MAGRSSQTCWNSIFDGLIWSRPKADRPSQTGWSSTFGGLMRLNGDEKAPWGNYVKTFPYRRMGLLPKPYFLPPPHLSYPTLHGGQWLYYWIALSLTLNVRSGVGLPHDYLEDYQSLIRF